jgi:hypothetical protein
MALHQILCREWDIVSHLTWKRLSWLSCHSILNKVSLLKYFMDGYKPCVLWPLAQNGLVLCPCRMFLWNTFCAFHDVKFICVSFSNFMVVVFMVITFIICFFKVTCASFKFFLVTCITFIYRRWHFSWWQVITKFVTHELRGGNSTICTSIILWFLNPSCWFCWCQF